MNTKKITKLRESFEAIVCEYENIEYWMARDIQKLLQYSEWRNFSKVIDKAKEAAKNSGESILDHFVEVNKTIQMPKGASKEITDVMLTRYACYVIAQNGDPRKEEIAFAQSYFAIQTRKQELVEDRIKLDERLRARKKLTESEKELSQVIYERGVDQKGFGRIRSKGDKVLFGGLSTDQMKTKLGVPKNKPLADFLPEVSIAAKYLANTITNFNVKNNNLYGEKEITQQHLDSNSNVRETLVKSGIKPEELEAEEDIKKIERRVKSGDKKLLKAEKSKK